MLFASTDVARAAPVSNDPLPAAALPPRLSVPASVLRDARSSTDGGAFVDANGEARSFALTYESWFGELSQEPHYVRALVEMGALLTLGLADYWLRPGLNKQDWDLPGFSERLSFHAVRFDNNKAITNFLSHPFAGSAYYGFARLNSLSVPESAIYAMLSSGVWEYFLEWREQASINDMIYTPAGGIAIGSFLFRLTDYLNSAPGGGSSGDRIASYSLGVPRRLHPRDEDPNAGPAELPPDSLGFSSAYFHSFQLGYDAAYARADDSPSELLHTLAVDACLVAMPGFLRPGRFGKVFASDNFTEFHLRLGFSGRGAADTDLRADGTLVGYYHQDFALGARGVYGLAEMVGFGPGLRYVERYYGGEHDMYASTHLGNLVGSLWFGLGPLRGHVRAEARYDFSAVRSLPLPEYEAAHGTSALKSVLTWQGYAFGAGAGERVEGGVSLASVFAGAYADHAWYRAVGGLDRMQSKMNGDVEGNDDILEYGTWLEEDLRVVPLYVRAFADWVARKSVLGDFEKRRIDRRVGFGAGLVL